MSEAIPARAPMRQPIFPKRFFMHDLLKFEKLVFACERLAERNPRAYRIRVFLLATLGFAFIASILLLSAGAGLLLFYDAFAHNHLPVIKFALFPTVIAWLLCRSLLVRIEPPQGFEITRESAPRFFSRIDEARAKLMASPIHRVVVDVGSFNVGVMQVPSFGVFGRPRNHLVIGLPFLEAVTPEELDFVLGHELGHLSGKQTRFRNWIYRIRQAWPRILEALSGGGNFMSGVFTRFLNWYAPYFNAYSFVLARANEYDADRAGAAVVGAAVGAHALLASDVFHDHLQNEFWPALFREAGADSEPPSDSFTRSLLALRRISPAEIEASMRRVLARRTSLADTHPCVADRLQALGETPRPPALLQRSAGELLLGELRESLVAEANSKWSSAIREQWSLARERHQKLAERVSEYSGSVDALDESGLLDYAALIEEAEGREQARPLVEAALSRQPDHAPSLFMRGRLRLADGDHDGVLDIERAMELSPDAREPGARILASYFLDRRDIERGLRYVETVQEADQRRSAAEAERSNVLPTDDFIDHGLGAAELERLRATLADLPVASVWLVGRRLKLSPGLANYVAVVAYARSLRPTQDQLNAILNAMPEDGFKIVTIADPKGAVTRKIAAMEGALVYGKARDFRSWSDIVRDEAANWSRRAFGSVRQHPAKAAGALAAVLLLAGYAQFRHDPRARFAYATLLIDLGAAGAAEAQLNILLGDDGGLDDNRFPDMESRARLTFAELLVSRSRDREAWAIAVPACRWRMPDALKARREALGFCSRH
ncbi:hypothetical protein A1351_09315 [Methylosinus sp. R-45379]|nr:hypothetical protein A1351_09315 [Methylosinus sp. R-45379]